MLRGKHGRERKVQSNLTGDDGAMRGSCCKQGVELLFTRMNEFLCMRVTALSIVDAFDVAFAACLGVDGCVALANKPSSAHAMRKNDIARLQLAQVWLQLACGSFKSVAFLLAGALPSAEGHPENPPGQPPGWWLSGHKVDGYCFLKVQHVNVPHPEACGSLQGWTKCSKMDYCPLFATVVLNRIRGSSKRKPISRYPPTDAMFVAGRVSVDKCS